MTTAPVSAGVLAYRWREGALEVLLAHPGGPLWAKRDLGAWTVPKGLVEAGEEPLAAALREFREETGLAVAGAFTPLTPIRQAGGKRVLCWAVEADLDLAAFHPGQFEMQWPPRSGRRAVFPEIDRVSYFHVEEARARILPAQAPLLDELIGRLA